MVSGKAQTETTGVPDGQGDRSHASMDGGPVTVAVLCGGIGREREVSLESGRYVAEALEAAGFDVVCSDIRPDRTQVLDRDDIDVFFLALHGEFGEDGRLQRILEDRGLVYTGCGPEASRLAFDKMASKRLFAKASLDVASAVEFTPDGDLGALRAELTGLGERFVVKPVRQGSSVGVYVVDGGREALATAQRVYDEFGQTMIEPFVFGREITVGVLDRRTLPIIEIRSKTGFYDYHAKYADDRTEYLFDTVESQAVRDGLAREALACFDALGCHHFARVDFILADDGTAYALEVNTIPGFTAHSLLPKAAARVGVSMDRLCAQIVGMAWSQRNAGVK